MRCIARIGTALGVLGIVSSGGLDTAHAAKRLAPLVDESVEANLASLDASGKWKAVPDCTVKLLCRPDSTPSPNNDWRNACTAEMKVVRNGKTIATQIDSRLEIDFRAVGGNSGSLALSVFDVGDLQLVVVTQRKREGDEASTATTTEQLLMIDGDILREVYRHDAVTENEPGPDGPDSERTKTTETIEVGKTKKGAVPELVVTTQTNDGKPQKQTLVWDGKRYIDKPVVLPPPAAVVDPVSGKSIEPQLKKALGGEALSPVDLAGLSLPALNLLRNALFARHGRAFKRPELQAFFYATRAPDRASKLLPRKVDPSFQESMLDAADKQNLAALQTAEKNARSKR